MKQIVPQMGDPEPWAIMALLWISLIPVLAPEHVDLKSREVNEHGQMKIQIPVHEMKFLNPDHTVHLPLSFYIHFYAVMIKEISIFL